MIKSIVETARNTKGKRINVYPKKGELMISKKLVVLVTGYGHGTLGYPCFSGVVLVEDKEANEDTMPVGYYSRTWTLDAFEKLNMTISLSPKP